MSYIIELQDRGKLLLHIVRKTIRMRIFAIARKAE